MGKSGGMTVTPWTPRRWLRTNPPSAPENKPVNSPSTRRSKMVNTRSIKPRLMLPLLALLLTACAGQPPPLPLESQPVKPAAIPALPPQARQLGSVDVLKQRCRQHSAGTEASEHSGAIGKSRVGNTSKIHLAVNAHALRSFVDHACCRWPCAAEFPAASTNAHH